MEITEEHLARFFEVVLPHMDELQRRVVAGAAAEMLGRGGKSAVAAASGMSRNTVIKAEREVAAGIEPGARLRAPGGGDKPLVDKQPGLLEALDDLVHPDTRGNPMSLLRWTSKSAVKLSEELVRQGYRVSARTVLRLLHRLGYSLQADAKVNEGRQHPDRDAQFGYLNDTAADFVGTGQPVISVDTKKKELIGNYKNGGREWAEKGEPERVEVHDFADPALGEFAKAVPYGIYDVDLASRRAAATSHRRGTLLQIAPRQRSILTFQSNLVVDAGDPFRPRRVCLADILRFLQDGDVQLIERLGCRRELGDGEVVPDAADRWTDRFEWRRQPIPPSSSMRSALSPESSSTWLWVPPSSEVRAALTPRSMSARRCSV